jgi:hypothetical protein
MYASSGTACISYVKRPATDILSGALIAKFFSPFYNLTVGVATTAQNGKRSVCHKIFAPEAVTLV